MSCMYDIAWDYSGPTISYFEVQCTVNGMGQSPITTPMSSTSLTVPEGSSVSVDVAAVSPEGLRGDSCSIQFSSPSKPSTPTNLRANFISIIYP